MAKKTRMWILSVLFLLSLLAAYHSDAQQQQSGVRARTVEAGSEAGNA